eukprot:scaffold15175_cov82-Cyclotella_meneghiniana.AAC.2
MHTRYKLDDSQINRALLHLFGYTMEYVTRKFDFHCKQNLLTNGCQIGDDNSSIISAGPGITTSYLSLDTQ